MAGPITWQNVNGASLSEASRPMEIAGRTMNGAFDNLRDVLKDRQMLEAANWQQGKVNNTNQALNSITGYASPEEFAAAQKAGAIQALLTNNGAQIDQQAVRAAADGRLSLLQDRAKAGIDYGNTMTDSAAAPIEDAYKAAAIKGDKVEMARLESLYQGRNRSNLVGFADARDQVGVDRQRATTKFGWDGEDQRNQNAAAADALLTNAAQRAASSASIAASKEARSASAEQRDWLREDRIAERKSKLRTEMGNLYDQNASSGGGSAKISEAINNIKDDSARLNATRALPDILAIPGMTTGAAINALATVEPSLWLNLDSSIRKKTVATALKEATSPAAIEQAKSNEVRKAMVMEEQLKLRLKEAKMSKDAEAIADLENKLRPRNRPERE